MTDDLDDEEDDLRPISIIGATRIEGDAAISVLREYAQAALSAPVGEVTTDDKGVHRVNHLPHEVAEELVKMIDEGCSPDELAAWMADRLGADNDDE